MKKPTPHIEGQSPRNIRRADVAPTDGYALIVDGHFKTSFDDEAAVTEAATSLLASYPMLQIKIYNAATKVHTLVSHTAHPLTSV